MGAEAPGLENILKATKNPSEVKPSADSLASEPKQDTAPSIKIEDTSVTSVENPSVDETAKTKPPFDKEGVLSDILEKVRQKNNQEGGLEGDLIRLKIIEKYFHAKREYDLHNNEKSSGRLFEALERSDKWWERFREKNKYVGYLVGESLITVPAAAIGAHFGIMDNSTAIIKAASRIGMNSLVKRSVDFLLESAKIQKVYNRIKNIFAKKTEKAPKNELLHESNDESIDLSVSLEDFQQNENNTNTTDVPVFSSEVSQTPTPVFSQDTNVNNANTETRVHPALIRYGAIGLSAGTVFLLSGGLAGVVSLGVTATKEVVPYFIKYIEKKVKEKKKDWIKNQNIDITLSPQELIEILEQMEYQYSMLEKKIARLNWMRTFTKGALDLGGCIAKWSAVVEIPGQITESVNSVAGMSGVLDQVSTEGAEQVVRKNAEDIVVGKIKDTFDYAVDYAVKASENLVHVTADAGEKVVKTTGKKYAKKIEKAKDKK